MKRKIVAQSVREAYALIFKQKGGIVLLGGHKNEIKQER
jgi:hypothetical protein